MTNFFESPIDLIESRCESNANYNDKNIAKAPAYYVDNVNPLRYKTNENDFSPILFLLYKKKCISKDVW